MNATKEEYVETQDTLDRLDAFEYLGFSKEQAIILNKVRYLSIATVRETYLKKGCSINTAFDILS